MFEAVLLVVVLGLPSGHVQAAPVVQQVCGTIVDTACGGTTPMLMNLLVQPGVTVRVDAPSVEAARDILKLHPLSRSERVCVTGQLLQRQTAVIDAHFMASATDIVLQGSDASDWPTADVYTACDHDVTMVTIKSSVRPNYTEDALKAHIQGRARVQAIIGVTGEVERVRLLKLLDPVHGLDEEALKAAKQWTFNPATKNGTPVRMQVTVELTFELRK